MAIFELELQPRETRRKAAAKAMRQDGKIPGVYYKRGGDAVAFSVGDRDLMSLLRKGARTHLMKIKSGDKSIDGQHALIRELQKDPLGDRVLHIDLQGVNLDERIKLEVPLNYIGIPVGEQAGGRADYKRFQISVQCRADRIPDAVDVPVGHLNLGQMLSASELVLPEGVELDAPGTLTLVMIEATRAAKAGGGEGGEEEGAGAEA